MNYYIEKETDYKFETAIEKVIQNMGKEGFGIIGRKDMHKTFKDKLNVSFRNYAILEACNPEAAYHAIKMEDNIGVLLPCNIVVQQTEDGKTKVAVVNPAEAMRSVKNDKMNEMAKVVQEKLRKAIESL